MGNKNMCCGKNEEPQSEQPTMSGNVQISSFEYKNIEIGLIQGEIQDERADVIVNACQGNPYSSTESHILRKAGQQIIQSLMGQAPPEVGEASHTANGALNCKNIVHVTLPKWEGEDGAQDDYVELIQAYKSVMKIAFKLNAKSIIFSDDKQNNPFAYPKIFHANALCIAITQFIDDSQGEELLLKSIKFVSHQSIVIRNFQHEIQKRLEMNSEQFLKDLERQRHSHLEKQYSEKNSLSSKNMNNLAQTVNTSTTKTSLTQKNVY